ncbi:hypothetical protein [Paenibacillus chitinolyticus]|nr:hypothetical protein [Paenibacillus chitinolyticus]MBV6717330.1 hypothetical protein [Paenibacillus chitinolyticus]
MYRLLLCFVKAIVANIPGAVQFPVPLSVLNAASKAAYRFAGLPFGPAGV